MKPGDLIIAIREVYNGNSNIHVPKGTLGIVKDEVSDYFGFLWVEWLDIDSEEEWEVYVNDAIELVDVNV